ncbi:hypothetical protein B0E53_03035 [Micromonospora sp. MH33]|uniref:DUF2637 domain-containing protein n=1 Tax=Micromonospora sp. MH33 TaxID=1945509 RepID=UPI000D2C9074|nr:DUF2637 domain-containing protein [Micromonospora sp. MH33]PSK64997.1 hypothetical protein B0E53_03035 [Micromonospora sp. MH33]
MTETQLRRMQWAVRATLVLGVAASVTANILHAQPNAISQAIAAWPPLALLITVELVTRIPIARRALGVLRIAATSTIAAIAAWISYHHMIGVVARYGETGTVPYLLPLSVDGLIIVASISLIELAARLREVEGPSTSTPIKTRLTTDPTACRAPVEPAARVSETDPALPNLRPQHPPLQAGTAHSEISVTAAKLPADHRSGENADDHGPDSDPREDDDPNDVDRGLASDLVPLLSAARIARAELTREGHTVSRDALARRLRRNGHSIRNSGVSELLAALRREERSASGTGPTTAV